MLVNRARSFIFSTAPPPAIAAAACAAIEFLNSDAGEHRRVLLWQRIGMLRRWLGQNPLAASAISETGSAIHPFLVGDEQTALDLARTLQANGFFVPAIRYPTVAKGAARLRITITAAHEEPQIRRLAETLRRLGPELTAAA
ncbi:MAG: aminotransferase class I/II-fold pyridoxal phosphate-dependent enzyme [Verrucomicrobiaceae bacterium]|nr:aminotransferase class I/II-fold pyridoxal phosphate-dependent enzyme [Verrucomicrobiaceae bacterium]